jgi:hypothetical protein
MNKEFATALKMYESVINQQLPSADYGLYQKAIIAGAMNKNAEKISLLQSLDRIYPFFFTGLMPVLRSPIPTWPMKITRQPLRRLKKCSQH